MKKASILLMVLVMGGIGYYFYHINTKEYKARKELDQLGIHGADQDRYINKNAPSSNEQSNTTNEKSYTANVCTVCGNKFSGKGYEEVANGDWKPCKEPYQCYVCSKMCGIVHTKKMNELVDKTINKQSDGKLYDNDACTLCKGSGLETGKNLVTGEAEERICPMCDGKGVKSY